MSSDSPEDRAVGRRAFIRELGGQAIRSVGAALTLGQELRQEVFDQLRVEALSESAPAETFAPASATRPVSPMPTPPLGDWSRRPATATRLLPTGLMVAVDQRALPQPAPEVELRSVREVVEAMRAGMIDGGLALVQAAVQALALAAHGAAGAPRVSAEAVVRGAANALAAARPDMPLVREVVGATAADAVVSDEPVPEALRRRAEALTEAIRSEHLALAVHGADWLAHSFGGRVRVLMSGEFGPFASGSAGTTSAILHAAADRGTSLEVWIPDGEPPGRSVAILSEALAGTAVTVHALPDVRVGGLLAERRVDVAMIGANWASARGVLAGAVGSSALAVLAKDAGVPVVGVVSRSAIVWDPSGPPPMRPGKDTDRRAILLDRVAVGWLASVVTDAGVVLPSGLGRTY